MSPIKTILAATLALAGCGLVGEGEQDAEATAPTSIDSALLECGDPDGVDDQA